jgi:hypothetical protein
LSSFGLPPMIATKAAVNTRNATQPSAAQPIAGQRRVGRRPKSAGEKRPYIRANSTALPMRHRSWTTVAVIVTAGGWSLKFAPNATATTPITSAPNSAAASPAMSATTDVHGGHRGSRRTSTPGGTSGAS